MIIPNFALIVGIKNCQKTAILAEKHQKTINFKDRLLFAFYSYPSHTPPVFGGFPDKYISLNTLAYVDEELENVRIIGKAIAFQSRIK